MKKTRSMFHRMTSMLSLKSQSIYRQNAASSFMMDIKFLKDNMHEMNCDAVIIPCAEDEKQNDYLSLCGAEFVDEYKRLQKQEVFSGKKLTSHTINTLGKLNVQYLILVGYGKKEDLTSQLLRRMTAKAHKVAKALKVKTYTTLLNQLLVESSLDLNEIVTETALLTNYEFNTYKKKSKEKGKSYAGPKTVYLWSSKSATKAQQEAIKRAQSLATATCLARDLVNTAPNELYPQTLANQAIKLRSANTKVTVFDEKKLKKMGCNGILAVGGGSVRQPRMVVIDYNPKQKQKSSKTLAVVGKGITFDSGGLNIKPGSYMGTMKSDMSGAAAALSVIKAAQLLKVPKRIFAVLGLAENMPGGRSYRPDDVVTMYSGKTVEIGNTDAEGRVVLGDCLAYTEKKIKPDQIIDFATLTGACVVALGHFTSGLMTTNDEMAQTLVKSGETTDDNVWRLPLWGDYKDLMKSNIADVQNISSGRAAGTITAAIFLQHFVEKTPWAHIDIAGTAFLDKAQHYKPKGGTGSGVRLIMEYLKHI